MSFSDKAKIQVLGLFILTSASFTFKNFEKQKRSILYDVWEQKSFLWARYKNKESTWDPIEDLQKDDPTYGDNSSKYISY